MKKFLPILLLAITPACYADLSHSITSSVKLTVGGATTSADRIGSSYSVSGTGVDTTYTSGGNAVANGVGSLVISSGIGTAPDLTVTQDVPANSFSFSQSLPKQMQYQVVLLQQVLVLIFLMLQVLQVVHHQI